MNKINQIQKLWFGVEKIENPIIVSPVQGIHQELLRIYKPKKELGGWYNPSVISLNKTDFLVVQIPMGKASEDIAKVIESSIPIYMLGYCGSLNRDLKIGEIVQNYNNSVIIPEFKKVKVQTMEGLLDNRYKENSEVVDMENELFERYIDNYSGYFIVSDLPYSKPFFQITKSDNKKIKQSQSKLIKLLGETI